MLKRTSKTIERAMKRRKNSIAVTDNGNNTTQVEGSARKMCIITNKKYFKYALQNCMV